MKVILTQTIDRLGKVGDIVTVKDGYARNYLFPKNVAKEATAGNMKALESLKKKQALEDANRLEAAKAIAEKLGALSITISAKAGEEEKLFGTVTTDMISKALEAEGISIDKKEIVLDEPIKKLGVYQAAVKVHPELKANLRVWIV
ncbi:MAG: 50S ribosomal protein L9, partial [Candidatus Omnitrophica bacterium]|nr:50S ribosomal protein L9 [Candidatus Omnitrophota bacterium]